MLNPRDFKLDPLININKYVNMVPIYLLMPGFKCYCALIVLLWEGITTLSKATL